MLKNKKLYLLVLFTLITLTFVMSGIKDNDEHVHADDVTSEQVVCPICYGAKTVTCPTCNGTGTYTCSNCHGTGTTSEMETCTYCDANGYPMGTEYIACDMCDGTGWDDCLEECCNECNGRGYFTLVTCSNCGGLGVYGDEELECTECQSSGKVIGYVAKCTVCDGEKIYPKTCTECTNGEKTCECDEGEVNCSLCNGVGTINHVQFITIRHDCENEDCVDGKELCLYCEGTKVCSICEGSGNCWYCGWGDPDCVCEGSNECFDCEGSGTCSNCGENGYNTCNDCEGLGYTEETKYAVYYDLNGGTGIAPLDQNYYNQGANVPIMSTTLTRKGYTFIGWNNVSTATTVLSSYTMGDSAVTFYAIWSPITHTCNNITFDKPLTSESDIKTLSSGNYYLYEDIQASESIAIVTNQTINLCLNGHSLDLNSHNIIINSQSVLNIYDCDTSSKHYFDIDQNNVWTLAADQSVATNNYCQGGVITGGHATAGGAFNVSSSALLNIYGGNFIGNSASEDGGVIYNGAGEVLLKNCYIAHNTANKGGAIYSHTDGDVTIVNSTIEYNSATTNGGGIYSYYSGCLVEGTSVTMADGSKKKIEDILEGDMIRTFDHETGKLSSEKVSLVYTSGKSTSFTLSFTNNIDLGIVDCHDLFEQSSLKYVTINGSNAKDYIGKYFYNANANRWEKLLSVSYNNEPCNYYSLYTARHNNSIANDMLTLPNDVDYLFNIFEFDESLKLNQTQKQADINKYGLYPYSIAKDYMSEEYYDAFNAKYLYIAMGKGLVSYEYVKQLNSDTREYIDEKNQSIQRRLNNLLANKTNMRKNTVQSEITAATYTGDLTGVTAVVLGSNAVITNNKVGTADNNIYFDGASAKIVIIKDATGIQAGISMAENGTFSSQVVDETGTLSDIISSNTFFTSDNSAYEYHCKKIVSTTTYYNCNIETKYSVTYDANAGTDTVTNMPSTDTNKYFVGDAVSLPAGTPVRVGYKFLGWATTSAGTVITTSTTPMVTNGITLYAIWEEKDAIEMDVNPQKLFYDGNEKTPALKDEEGETLSITGFSFAYERVIEGGYEACSEAITPCQYRVHITRDEDDDYKAFDEYVLLVVTYTVTYKANTGVGDDIVDESDDSINHCFYGDYDLYCAIKALIKTNTFTKENYSFAFWNTQQDGKGTTYDVNSEYELSDNLVLYACYSANISVQPNKDNDYQVAVSTTDTVSYQWEKGTYQPISVSIQNDLLNGTYDSTLGTITSDSNQIVIKAHSLNTLLKFISDTTLSDGVTPVGSTYTYHAIIGKGIYYVINASEEFTISNIEFYALKFDAIVGETSNTISSATENAKYRCAITSLFNGVSYSNEIVPKQISFVGGANTFSSVAIIDMYQLENRTITVPENVFWRADYKFTTWDDGTATYDVDETYTVGSTDVIFTAQWEEKLVATDNSTNTSFDYDGKNHATLAEIEACISIVDENEEELTPSSKYYSFDGASYYSANFIIWSDIEFINADVYTIYYEYEFDDYKTVKGSFTMTINKVKVTVPSAITGLIYNTKEQTGVATSTLYSITNNKKTEVGSYDAVATLLDKTNYLWDLATPTVEDQTITWSIAKCKVSVPTQSNTLTYNGTMQSPTWDDTSLVTCTSLSDLEAILPNTYEVKFDLNNTTSYEWTDGTIEEKTTQWTINKKDVTITANNQSIVYGETISSTVANVTVNGLVESDEISAITLTTTDVNVTTTGVITASSAAIYNGDVDYTEFYNITYAPGVLTITKGQAVITIDTTAIVSTYGDTLTLPTYSNNFGTVLVDKTAANLVNVGTYTVNYTIEGTDNYNGDTESVSVTINPAKVTKPSANTKTFTYTGSKQTYTLTTNTVYTISNNTRTDAGSQTVTVSLNDKANYVWDETTPSTTDLEYTFTINKAKVNEPKVSGTYTYTGKAQTVKLTGTATYMTTTSTLIQTNAGTYTITYTLDGNHEWNTNNDGEVSWTIAVAKNPITVDQTSIVKKYAEEIVLPTATSKFGTVVCDTVAADLVNVGKYTVTYKVEGTENYEGDSKTVSVTINPLELGLVLSSESPIVVTYGETVTDPTTTTTNPAYDSYIKFTKKYYRIIDLANEVVEEVSEMVNAGEYAIIYFASSQTDNIDLSTKKVVFVTINKMKVQEPKLVNEYTYTGKTQTATLTGVEDYMTTTSTLTQTNAGTYTITYTLDNNHEWDKNNDGEITWKINKANAVIDINAGTIFNTYGETVVLPEYSTNFGEVVVDKTSADLVNAGTYTVTYTVEGTDNYNGDTKKITVIINKAASKITVDQTAIVKTYGEEIVLPTASATFGNVVVDKTSADLVNVGTYIVTYKVEDTDNYTGDIKTVNVTINKANASITIGQKAITKVYGQTVVLPVGNSNFGTVVCDKTSADLVNVGTYTVTYTVEGTENYNGDSKTITVKINKAKVAEPKVVNAYKYNGNAQTVELTGVESFMATSDSLTQTNAGVYTIKYTLDDNHEWDKNSDGEITWEIKEVAITPEADPTEPEKKQEVVVETEEGFSSDITIEVEVTVEAEVETKELAVDYYNITEETAKLAEDEKVSLVFEVKLIQTINGIKKEIQPEDIAPGTKIKVKMLIPETVDVTKVTRILHVHSANDIESINFDASKMDENRYYEIEVNRLSEFAYIYQVEKEAFPVWAIILIVIAGILLIFIGFFFIWKKEFDSTTKKEQENKKNGENKSISRKLKFLDPIYRPINKLFFGGKKKDKEEK